MTKTKHIGFLGAGAMGQSLITGLIQHGFLPQQLWACDHHPEKLATLNAQYSIHTLDNAQALVNQVDVLVLAVKPQDIKTTLTSIKAELNQKKPLIISIAAGITSQQLQHWIGDPNTPLIRAMPNTPSLLGTGMTGLYATENTSTQDREIAENILQAVGEILWVNDEALIDVVTALSGSGPAYFFYMLESLIEGGVSLGLSPSEAQKLACQTGLGAMKMAIESKTAIGELRTNVTSKGGTTEAGLNSLKTSGFKEIITNALRAATNRSKELSKLNN